MVVDDVQVGPFGGVGVAELFEGRSGGASADVGQLHQRRDGRKHAVTGSVREGGSTRPVTRGRGGRRILVAYDCLVRGPYGRLYGRLVVVRAGRIGPYGLSGWYGLGGFRAIGSYGLGGGRPYRVAVCDVGSYGLVGSYDARTRIGQPPMGR